MSLPYVLSARQEHLYSERIDLYRPVVTPGSENTFELAYSNIPAQLVPTDNFDVTQGAIRQKANNIQTSDSLHVHVDQEIGPEWMIYIRPGSVRYPDDWYVALGERESHGFHAKYGRVYVNQAIGLTPEQIV